MMCVFFFFFFFGVGTCILFAACMKPQRGRKKKKQTTNDWRVHEYFFLCAGSNDPVAPFYERDPSQVTVQACIQTSRYTKNLGKTKRSNKGKRSKS